MSRTTKEGGILAGTVDGAVAAPGPLIDVAGVPHPPVVYESGDLAAIPWAFQSTEFLSSRAEAH